MSPGRGYQNGRMPPRPFACNSVPILSCTASHQSVPGCIVLQQWSSSSHVLLPDAACFRVGTVVRLGENTLTVNAQTIGPSETSKFRM